MPLIARLAPLLLLPLLAGCEPVDPGVGPVCAAAELQGLVGQPEALAHTLENPSGAIRIIRPGQAVTMDYSPSRLNVEIGADGRVASVHCG